MKLSKIISSLEILAPLPLQESYDNAGLLIGSPENDIKQALISLDVTSEVIDEAMATQCNLIIAHHPLIFKGIKKLNGHNDVEKSIIKAIKNDIAIYAIHTNLDNVFNGVNNMLSKKLGLINLQILSPKDHMLRKLITYCPIDQSESVRTALFQAGAGNIGNYDSCSFNQKGTGTYRGNITSQPFAGIPGKFHTEEEVKIETIVPAYSVKNVLRALKNAHPYEEVAYDIFPIDNTFDKIGSGMIGELGQPMKAKDFLEKAKTALGCEYIKHNTLVDRPIRSVAVCGGSGSFLINAAHRAGADIFVTGDVKYHEFYEHLGLMTIADAGHFETEQGTKELLESFLTKKFPNFALRISKKNVNPVSFL